MLQSANRRVDLAEVAGRCVARRGQIVRHGLDVQLLPGSPGGNEVLDALGGRDMDDVERTVRVASKQGGALNRLGLRDRRPAVVERAQVVPTGRDHPSLEPRREIVALAVDERDRAERCDRLERLQELSVVHGADTAFQAFIALVGDEELERARVELDRILGGARDLIVVHQREVEREVDVRAPLCSGDLLTEPGSIVTAEVAVHLQHRGHPAQGRRAGLGRVVIEITDGRELNMGVDRSGEHVPSRRIDFLAA